MEIGRPLDFLNDLKKDNKNVIVERKGEGEPIEGKIISFDIHINLVIETKENTKFIRGDVIETVTPKN